MPDDAFKGYQRGLNAPASDAFPVIPSNTADLPHTARALYIGGSGDVRLSTIDGSDVTFRSLGAGSVLPVGAVRVYETGTTAGSILGLV